LLGANGVAESYPPVKHNATCRGAVAITATKISSLVC
jgi:hypothetical protein